MYIIHEDHILPTPQLLEVTYYQSILSDLLSLQIWWVFI